MAFKADRVKLKPDIQNGPHSNSPYGPNNPAGVAGEITITTANATVGGDYQLKIFDPDTAGTAHWKTVGPYTGGDGITINSGTGVIDVDLSANSGLSFDGGTPNKLQIEHGSADGELMIWNNTTALWNKANLAGTTNEVQITNTAGGIQIGLPNDVTIGNDLTVTGNLTVNGDTTTISTTNLDVSDAIIVLQAELGSGVANATDMGIIMERGSSGDNAALIWDEDNDKFLFGTTAETGADTDVTVAVGTVQVGKLEIDGTTNHIDVASTNLTATAAADFKVDAEGNIELDANGGTVDFKDDGTSLMQLTNAGLTFPDATIVDTTGGNLTLDAASGAGSNDSDIIFKVDDNGSEVTALTIDGSELGSTLVTPADGGHLKFDDGGGDGNVFIQQGVVQLERNLAAGAIGDAPTLRFKKSRGDNTTQAASNVSDILGLIEYQSYDTGWSSSAYIQAKADGPPMSTHGTSSDTTDVPSKIEFGIATDAEEVDFDEPALILSGAFYNSAFFRPMASGYLQVEERAANPMTFSRIRPTGESLFQSMSNTAHATMEFKRFMASGFQTINTTLGHIKFTGAAESAAIIVKADEAHGANDAPGRLEFHTTADGANSTTERMVIKSDGNVGIAETSPGATLHVGGTDAIIVPSGTDAQRTTGVAGMIRFNTTSTEFEGYDGSAWGELGGSSTTGTVTSITAGVGLDPSSAITTSGTIDLNLSSLDDGTANIDRTEDELIYLDNSESTDTDKGKRKLTSEIALKAWKNCGLLPETLVSANVTKMIQVTEVNSSITFTLNAQAQEATILFANKIDGVTQKHFQIDLIPQSTGSAGFYGSSINSGTSSDPYKAAIDLTSSHSVALQLDMLRSAIENAIVGSASGHINITSPGVNVDVDGNTAADFEGWDHNYGSGALYTVTTGTNSITITAINNGSEYDFTGVGVTGATTAGISVSAIASVAPNYELKNPSIDHLSDVDTSSTAPTISTNYLRWHHTSGTWLPDNHSNFSGVSVTEYESWNQTSKANGFPLDGSGNWTADFVSATNYSGGNWVDLVAGEMRYLDYECFVNYDNCGSQKYKVKPADEYNQARGYHARIEIINLDANNMNVEVETGSDPSFVIPQGANGTSFVVGPSQKALLVANRNSSNVREWIVSILSV